MTSVGKHEIPYLKVSVFVIEGDVDGKGGRVMVGPQVSLPVRCVFYHEVHYSVTLRRYSNTSSQMSVYLTEY